MTLQPLHSIGPYIIGSNFLGYEHFQLEKKIVKEDGTVKYQDFKRNCTLFLDGHENIESVICDGPVYFRDVNLIGIDYDHFLSTMNLRDQYEADELDFEEDDISQLVYDIDEVGLQVWTKFGKVVTLIVSNPNLIDEEDTESDFQSAP